MQCSDCGCELETDDLYPERLWCWRENQSFEFYRDVLVRLGRK